MRAKIYKDIDLKLLDAAIAQFEKEKTLKYNNNSDTYIIMSEDTRIALFNIAITESKLSVETSNSYNIIKEYKGNRIAIDNGIPYGQVEICEKIKYCQDILPAQASDEDVLEYLKQNSIKKNIGICMKELKNHFGSSLDGKSANIVVKKYCGK